MEKFNAIKILEKELVEKQLMDTNVGKETYMKKVFNFVEVYLKPNIKKKLTNENIIAPKDFIEEIRQDVLKDKNVSEENKKVLLKEETINTFYFDRILNQLITQADNLINALGLIDDYDDEENIIYSEDDKILHWLNPEEVGFLGKDKKTKEKVANKICNTLVKMLKENLDEDTKKSDKDF